MFLSQTLLRKRKRAFRFLALCCAVATALSTFAGTSAPGASQVFPRLLESYGDSQVSSLWKVLQNRIQQEPLNLWVTLLFVGAIAHTFFTHKFLHWAHVLKERHKLKAKQTGGAGNEERGSAAARALHFFGEVEAVFGIWCLPLL